MSSVIKPWLQLSRVALGLHIAMKYGRNLPTVTLPMSVNKFVISAPKPNMKRRKNVLLCHAFGVHINGPHLMLNLPTLSCCFLLLDLAFTASHRIILVKIKCKILIAQTMNWNETTKGVSCFTASVVMLFKGVSILYWASNICVKTPLHFFFRAWQEIRECFNTGV